MVIVVVFVVVVAGAVILICSKIVERMRVTNLSM
jgi:hypothetical protein